MSECFGQQSRSHDSTKRVLCSSQRLLNSGSAAAGKARAIGTLFFGASRTAIELDDRTLAHLQMVTLTKLRRHESFAVSWRDDPGVGDGRSTVWITPSTDLHFKYSGSRPPMIEKERLEEMAAASNATHGIQLDDEATLVEPPRR